MCDETTEYQGFTIKVEHDEYPLNPREDYDNLGTFMFFHRRYDFGDEHDFSTDDYDGWSEFEADLDRKGYFWLPVYMYDHSIQSISTESFVGRSHHGDWDSGRLGFVAVHKDKVREWYGVKRITKKTIDRVYKCLKTEVETFDQYMRGECYFITVENSDGDVLDSCGGYLGDDSLKYGIDEAKGFIDRHIEADSLCFSLGK